MVHLSRRRCPTALQHHATSIRTEGAIFSDQVKKFLFCSVLYSQVNWPISVLFCSGRRFQVLRVKREHESYKNYVKSPSRIVTVRLMKTCTSTETHHTVITVHGRVLAFFLYLRARTTLSTPHLLCVHGLQHLRLNLFLVSWGHSETQQLFHDTLFTCMYRCIGRNEVY